MSPAARGISRARCASPLRGVADRLSTFTYKTSNGGATVYSSGGTGSIVSTNVTDERSIPSNARIISLFIFWSDYEASDNSFDAMIEAAVDFTLADAHKRGYSIIFRLCCGARSPAWLWPLISATSGFAADVVQGSTPVRSPYPTDLTYINRQTRVMARWATLMGGNCPAGGHPRAAHVVMVAASRAVNTGTEMEMPETRLVSTAYSGGTQTTAGAVYATDMTMTMTATGAALDAAGWPTGNHIIRLGGLGAVDYTTYGIRRVGDSFVKAAATSTLGLVQQGWAWTTAGTASQYALTGTAGTMTCTASGQALNAVVTNNGASAGTWTDIDVTAQVAWTPTPNIATHGPGVRARHADTANYYRVLIRQASTGVTVLRLQKRIGGVSSTIGTDFTMTNYVVNTTMSIRLQVSGSTTTVVNAKAWTGTSEPTAWQNTYTDMTSPLLSGSVGIDAYNDGTDTSNPVFTWTGFQAVDAAGAELAWVTRTGGSNVLTVNSGGRGWPGSGPRDWAASTAVEYCSQAAWSSGTNSNSKIAGATLDGVTGDFDGYAANWASWNALSTRTARRAAFQAAWLADVAYMQDTFPDNIRIGMTGGDIFGDFEDGAVSPKLAVAILNTLNGQTIAGSSHKRTGERLVVMTTAWTTNFAGVSGNINTFLIAADGKNALMGLQTKGASSYANIDAYIAAAEDALSRWPSRLLYYETFNAAFVDTANVSSAAYGNWPGGTVAGKNGYLIAASGAMQGRF